MTLGACPHYRIFELQLDSRAIRPLGFIARSAPVAWCAHPQSPVPMGRAAKLRAAGFPLRCDGDVARCPLTAPVQ